MEIYMPFDDAPEYENDYPTWFKIAAGAAVALLVGAVVGVIVFFAAPALLALTATQAAVA